MLQLSESVNCKPWVLGRLEIWAAVSCTCWSVTVLDFKILEQVGHSEGEPRKQPILQPTSVCARACLWAHLLSPNPEALWMGHYSRDTRRDLRSSNGKMSWKYLTVCLHLTVRASWGLNHHHHQSFHKAIWKYNRFSKWASPLSPCIITYLFLVTAALRPTFCAGLRDLRGKQWVEHCGAPRGRWGQKPSLLSPGRGVGALSVALVALRATSTPVPCSKKPAGSGSSRLFSPEHIAWWVSLGTEACAVNSVDWPPPSVHNPGTCAHAPSSLSFLLNRVILTIKYMKNIVWSTSIHRTAGQIPLGLKPCWGVC